MGYVVGFVAGVPAENKSVYVGHAEEAIETFRKYGVKRMLEAWGDDVPKGEHTDFYRAVAAESDEVVVFAVHEYPDAATAEAADAAMQNDPAMEQMGTTMPFDATRMIWGGFDVISDVKGSGPTGYVEGSIIAVPGDQRSAYKDYVDAMGALFVEFGAVRSVDAWGVMVPDGKVTDFKRGVAAGDGEAVVLGWIEWPSKVVRDAAWPKLMNDSRMQQATPGADESRRVFGGFVPVLDSN